MLGMIGLLIVVGIEALSARAYQRVGLVENANVDEAHDPGKDNNQWAEREDQPGGRS